MSVSLTVPRSATPLSRQAACILESVWCCRPAPVRESRVSPVSRPELPPVAADPPAAEDASAALGGKDSGMMKRVPCYRGDKQAAAWELETCRLTVLEE